MRVLSVKTFLKKLLILFFSCFCLGLGSFILKQASIGGDAVFSLQISLFNLLSKINPQSKFGDAVQILNGFFFLLMLFTNKKDMRIATVIIAIFTGVFINLIVNINNTYRLFLECEKNSVESYFTFLLGLLVIAFSISLYIKQNCGVAPFENVAVIHVKTFRVRFGVAKILVDIEFVVLALIFQSIATGKPLAIFGFGTLIAIILTGPLIDVFLLKPKKYPKWLAPKINLWYNIL